MYFAKNGLHDLGKLKKRFDTVGETEFVQKTLRICNEYKNAL